MTTYKHIDLGYLDIMSDGDDDMKKTMLEMLLDEMPAEVQKMQEVLANSDWEELGKVSHKMKSTLAFIGSSTLTDNNAQLELNCKNNENLDQNATLVSIIAEQYALVAPELKAAFDAI